eukprot:snap_masked-scaffold_7-processed-gene-1.22-mRNA-1 protein AED:1.00 eAED:1.00 QI:0/0/0/0/1/1/2/0/585
MLSSTRRILIKYFECTFRKQKVEKGLNIVFNHIIKMIEANFDFQNLLIRKSRDNILKAKEDWLTIGYGKVVSYKTNQLHYLLCTTILHSVFFAIFLKLFSSNLFRINKQFCKLVFLGAGSGAEVLGLLCFLDLFSTLVFQKFELVIVDREEWSEVFPIIKKIALYKAINLGIEINVTIYKINLLDKTSLREVEKLVNDATLVSFFYSFNELFEADENNTTELINKIISSMQQDAVLLLLEPMKTENGKSFWLFSHLLQSSYQMRFLSSCSTQLKIRYDKHFFLNTKLKTIIDQVGLKFNEDVKLAMRCLCHSYVKESTIRKAITFPKNLNLGLVFISREKIKDFFSLLSGLLAEDSFTFVECLSSLDNAKKGSYSEKLNRLSRALKRRNSGINITLLLQKDIKTLCTLGSVCAFDLIIYDDYDYYIRKDVDIFLSSSTSTQGKLLAFLAPINSSSTFVFNEDNKHKLIEYDKIINWKTLKHYNGNEVIFKLSNSTENMWETESTLFLVFTKRNLRNTENNFKKVFYKELEHNTNSFDEKISRVIIPNIFLKFEEQKQNLVFSRVLGMFRPADILHRKIEIVILSS